MVRVGEEGAVQGEGQVEEAVDHGTYANWGLGFIRSWGSVKECWDGCWVLGRRRRVPRTGPRPASSIPRIHSVLRSEAMVGGMEVWCV